MNTAMRAAVHKAAKKSADPEENTAADRAEDAKAVHAAMQHPDVLGAGAAKRKTLSPENDRAAIMAEWKRGTLHSGSGQKVSKGRKGFKQAIAIAMSESGKRKS